MRQFPRGGQGHQNTGRQKYRRSEHQEIFKQGNVAERLRSRRGQPSSRCLENAALDKKQINPQICRRDDGYDARNYEKYLGSI
jgi:hypothetical protein